MTDQNEKLLFLEFKAPLLEIIGLTDLLKQDVLSTEQRHAITRNIEESAVSMLTLVNKIIDNRKQVNTAVLKVGTTPEAVNELKELVATQSAAAPRAEVPISDIKILVVEDNPLLQLVILKQLAHLGLRADSVDNGQAAVDRARDYDLIFMDCRLPVLDGFDATRAIRALETEWKKTFRIVALTAGYEDKTREKCLQSGMDDCLIKPVSSLALRQVIERWFALPVSNAV